MVSILPTSPLDPLTESTNTARRYHTQKNHPLTPPEDDAQTRNAGSLVDHLVEQSRRRERPSAPPRPPGVPRLRPYGKTISPFSRPLSSKIILESYVSSSRSDVYRIHSTLEERTYAPPFACAASNGAKAGRNSLIAVASQEGSVDILNAAHRELWESEPQRTSICPHYNAIFDVRWSTDDSQLVTSSGDHSSVICDVETQSRVSVFSGHDLTVKTTIWDPSNPSLLVSGARDGNISWWDTRIWAPGWFMDGAKGWFEPARSIPHAHAEVSNGRRVKGAPKTVTSLNFIPNQGNVVMSSGSADGVLKMWDNRKGSKPVYTSPDPTVDLASTPGSLSRSRGISSVVVDESGEWAWALGRNASIYTYRLHPHLHDPFPVDPLTHPALEMRTFYPKLALSPDGAHLAAGSSSGAIVLWDARAILRPGGEKRGVKLVGHAPDMDVCGLDWAEDMLVSASDDCSVRAWRPDPSTARMCRDGGEVEDDLWGFAME